MPRIKIDDLKPSAAVSEEDMRRISGGQTLRKPLASLRYGKDGAKGGNVEFEWKVEEGES